MILFNAIVVALTIDGDWLICCMLYANFVRPARPLGYLRAETHTRGVPAGPSKPGPPWEVGLPAGEGLADTGSASSVDIDSDSPTAAPFGLTNLLLLI